MGFAPSTNYPSGNFAPLIDKMLGNAFWLVKLVADNISYVQYNAQNMDVIVAAGPAATAAASSATAAATSATAAASNATSATSSASASAASATAAAASAAQAAASASAASYSTVTKTSAYTAVSSDYLIRVDCTSGPVTITLPAAASRKQAYSVKKIDSSSNVVTVLAVGSDRIDGAVSQTISAQWASLALQSDIATSTWNLL